MIFWLICGLLVALAVAALLLPLLRPAKPALDLERPDMAVYRDQLSEIERDQARGLLSEEQAAAARLEIERRLLTAAESQATDKTAAPAQANTLLAAVVALLVPLAALGLYLGLGAPGTPGQPFVERPQAPAGDMLQMAQSLSQRLAREGGSRDDWLLLSRTYAQLERYGEAANAARQALEQGGEDPETHGFIGEMLVAVAGGQVTAEARQAFARSLELQPNNPRALYFSGLALAQDGQGPRALALWTELAEGSPPEAPWMPMLRQQIGTLAGELGIETPAVALAAPPPAAEGGIAGQMRGPSAADIEAAQSMSAEDRMAMIRSMVEGLAERLESAPDDLEGWLRLSRAYLVLNEQEKAAAAVGRAEGLVESLPADAPERAAVEAARRAVYQAGG